MSPFNSNEFLVRFKCEENLIRFSKVCSNYSNLVIQKFCFDGLFFIILPKECFDYVQGVLYDKFNVHDYDFCYPYAVLIQPNFKSNE